MPVLTAAAAVCFLAPCATLPQSDDQVQEVQLKLVSSGAGKMLGGYVPCGFWPTEQKPATIKMLPEGLRSPRFAFLPLAGKEGAKFHVILDEPNAPGAQPRLYADANGDGDMTNDAPADWKMVRPAADGQEALYSGAAVFDLGEAGKPYPARFEIYVFGTGQDKIHYYRDFATEGRMKLGDKTYRVMLSDESSTGDFTPLKPADGDFALGSQFYIDVNGDGAFESGEYFKTHEAFKVGETVYELADVARNGLSFKVRKSDRKVGEPSPSPEPTKRVELLAGHKAPVFEGKSTEGKEIQFPAGYKGKIVMVDFWATWCAPCMREMPHVVAAKEKFAAEGFEVLGVTLDRSNADEKIKSVAAKNKMTWPQIYDDLRAENKVAALYGVKFIPVAYLVDGDTGSILATGESLAGEELEKTIAAELKKRKK